jgi:hypothetical protein
VIELIEIRSSELEAGSYFIRASASQRL